MKEDELNRALYELSLLRERIGELQRQASALQGISEGAAATAEAVSSIGKEAMFQLGAGAMMKAGPTGGILVDMGSGTIVETKPDEAKKILEARAAQANAALQQVQKAISEAANRARELNEAVREAGRE
ncbi:MAG: hypothetical protein NTY90_01290 [Candidatus Micrarchaeota archaeon]|nr:hypothetical protein [Candidatus Micrarchaeota archaeon]